MTYPAGFEEQQVVGGLTRPTNVAWAPDGRTFVVEKDGLLKVVAPGGSTASLVLDLNTRVNSAHDRGLLGLAVDSQFAQHPYLYLLYTYELNPMTPDSTSPMVSQLLRVRINSASQVTEQTVLMGTYTSGVCPAPANTLDCLPSEGLSHSIGTVRSAPDGTLWVGNGDAASFSYVDPVALRTYDEQSLAGKLMHVDRNGMGLPGHPFCPGDSVLSHACTKLHAKGFRNPFRFALRPGGGITLGDVGWDQREEIDLISTAVGGLSYGWPCYEGSGQTNGYNGLAACSAEYDKGPGAHRGPDYDYPHAGSRAVMGGPTYTGTDYPAGYSGSIFFSDYSGAFIKRLVPASGGGYSAQDFASGWAGVALESGPDQNLTYVSFGTGGTGAGSIRRIVSTAGNASPVPSIQANPTSGTAPLTVSFSAAGSRDPDGDVPLSYSWNFGDGSPASAAVAPSHTYTEAGLYTARLTVTDGRGKSASATAVITSGNAPPVVTITGATTYRGGETFSLAGAAVDEQDGPLPPSALDWDVRVIHAGHEHFAGTPDDVAQIDVDAITDHDADSHYRVILTATDSDGATAEQTAVVNPETTTVRLRSAPAGASLSWGGTSFVAPRDLTTAIGYHTSVGAPATFDQAGALFDFLNWSDGGSAVHDYTVPPAGGTLTATYADPSGGISQSGGQPGDDAGPVLRFTGFDARPARLRGIALDQSRVRVVRVALRARARGSKCRWWLPARKRLGTEPRSCERPRWLTASLSRRSGGVRWTAKLGAAPPEGRYRVQAEAVDAAGNRSRLRSRPGTLIRIRR